MGLKERLQALQEESGKSPRLTNSSISAMAERVRRLRPRGYMEPPNRARVTEADLARMVGGEMITAGVILVEKRIDLSNKHGNWTLHDLYSDKVVLPEVKDIDPERWLFLDTETTGLSGGTGTLVFLLGLARIHQGSLCIRQYLLTRFEGESALLREVGNWLEDIQGIVSYNGKSFDIPLLSARFRLSSVEDVLVALRHIDLLHPIRRAFATRWNDCRLTTAETNLIQFYRENDLLGSEAPQVWFDYVHQNNPERLPDVFRHNYWDLLSVAVLLPAIALAYRYPQHTDADILAIAKAYLKVGDEDHALNLLNENIDHLDESGLLVLGRLLKRKKHWSRASAIWAQLAASHSIEAIEQLAKYHEHVKKDPQTALCFTRRLPAGEESRRRAKRLEERINKQFTKFDRNHG